MKTYLQFPCGARFEIAEPGMIDRAIKDGSKPRRIGGKQTVAVVTWEERGSSQRPTFENGQRPNCLSGCSKRGPWRRETKLWPDAVDKAKPFYEQLRFMVTCCPEEITE